MEIKERKPYVAVVLSLSAPGLGQVYNGQSKKGLTFYITWTLFAVLMPLVSRINFVGLILSVFTAVGMLLYILFDALSVAKTTKEKILRWPFNAWPLYIILFLLNVGINSMVRSEFIENIVPGIIEYVEKDYDSEGMAPTLLTRERLIIDPKYYQTNKPRFGDIIIFPDPNDPRKTISKRILATEHDRIESRDRILYRNGQTLTESYVQHTDEPRSHRKAGFGPLTVPSNMLFVMGDNRDRSIDSRDFGFIEYKAIQGKVLYIYWSKKTKRIGKNIQ